LDVVPLRDGKVRRVRIVSGAKGEKEQGKTSRVYSGNRSVSKRKHLHSQGGGGSILGKGVVEGP